MSLENIPTNNSEKRIKLVEIVQTPLAFFVLNLTIIEAILAFPAIFSNQVVSQIAIIIMGINIFFLVIIVSLFAWFRPEALSGKRPERNIYRELKVGDIVVICYSPLKKEINLPKIIYEWEKARDRYAGEITQITKIDIDPFAYRLTTDNGSYPWPREWLVLLS